jgi:ABC-type bacteriocin/lantibiotic exporter with double-glycine peptidase domain
MVLNSLNCNPPMYELRELCKCDEEGTSPGNAISAIKKYGFEYSAVVYLENIDELKVELSNGFFPIVYLRISETDSHSVVVVKISKNKVSVLDPQFGERDFDLTQFVEFWSATRGLTLLIE